jgi:hypothetical protein
MVSPHESAADAPERRPVMRRVATLDRRLSDSRQSAVLALSLFGVLVVGVLDYLGGYEVSFSIV